MTATRVRVISTGQASPCHAWALRMPVATPVLQMRRLKLSRGSHSFAQGHPAELGFGPKSPHRYWHPPSCSDPKLSSYPWRLSFLFLPMFTPLVPAVPASKTHVHSLLSSSCSLSGSHWHLSCGPLWRTPVWSPCFHSCLWHPSCPLSTPQSDLFQISCYVSSHAAFPEVLGEDYTLRE